MSSKVETITVFEHKALRQDQVIKGVVFDEHKLKALQAYYGETGVPYYTLIHKGVCFNEHVGVIQVGNLVIEVLPKIDQSNEGSNQETYWRDLLIDMMREAGVFSIHATSESTLGVKPNCILDLYIELFLAELNKLLHDGLVKKYRKKEGNLAALKGSLCFPKHIQHNVVHQERFYVKYSTYDTDHLIHKILFKALRLIDRINSNANLHSSIQSLILHFPELQDLMVSESTFERICLDRKTIGYKKALDIARLLLLNYHPDLSTGKNHLLALMFNMNDLWEKFVYQTLRKKMGKDVKVTAQTSKYFWKPENGRRTKMRPDIWMSSTNENFILDTKWKDLKHSKPKPEDLRQMYVYHDYYEATKVALIYPGNGGVDTHGHYIPITSREDSRKECSVILLSIPKAQNSQRLIRIWQNEIVHKIENWMITY